jgi:hypothetical protein
MPNDVIVWIRNLARQARANRGLLFSNQHDSDDKTYHPDDASHSTAKSDSDDDDDYNGDADPLDEAHIAGVNANNEPNHEHPEDESDNDESENDNNHIDAEHDDDNEHIDDMKTENNDEHPNNNVDESIDDVDDETRNNDNQVDPGGDHNNQPNKSDTINDMEETYGTRNSQHALRPRRRRDYSHLQPQPVRPRDYSHLHTTLKSAVMTQHSMKKGLKLFGEATHAAKMTPTEQKRALNYLMFLKKKRSRIIKDQGCAHGRKQREYTTKEDASAPTVAIESVLLSCVIDAKEGRDVATVDIPGAFMQANMDELVHMKLEGKMAELLVRLEPKLYRKYIQTVKGKQVLYVELKKALYGTLRAALLFWKKLSAKLQEWDFAINPCDWCVANKIINGKQCTILWHVDDIKISHTDSSVVSSIIQQL